MSLRFVMGSSGAGKSTFLYKEIVRQAKDNPLTNYYVIVPEQFTMQTQRELVEKSGSGIMNIDVVSFQRLAYRVFDEIGQLDMVVLEETGKNLLLRKVAEEKKDALTVLSGNMKKMGYVSEIKSLISELTQYNISPETLENFFREQEMSYAFSCKMKDVLTMYRGFEDKLQGQYVTAEEILEVFRLYAGKSKLLKNSVLALDGFTGFTPIQNNLLAELMKLVQDIYVTVTIDPREDAFAYRDMQELFAMSKKTVVSLTRMADSVSMKVEEPLLLKESEHSRFAATPMLAALEYNLFRIKQKEYLENDDAIRIYGLGNPREELIFTAGEIKRLVREKGYRYKDIAVVTGNVEGYGNYVPQIFSQYEIPFFLDTTKNILLHPFIEFVRAMLEILESDFSYESVFRYFRSNLVPMQGLTKVDKWHKIDNLENYVLASGIRGYRSWKKRFSYLPKNMSKDQLEELEELRKSLMESFEPLYRAFHGSHITVREQCIALYDFMNEHGIEQQLKDRETAYKEQGDFVKEKEYAQIYRIVMDLLDKMATLLGEDELTIQEFSEILDAGFEAAKVGVIPSGYDRVMVGDIERTRLEHIKVLFFIGVNDGIIPKADARGGIISQFEREELAKQQLELAPTARERVFMQRFYLYLTMTKASDYLYITCARVGGDGQALRKSYLIGTLQKMFPALTVRELEELPIENQIVTPKSSMPFFLEGLQQNLDRTNMIADDSKQALWKSLKQWYEQDKNYQGILGQLESAKRLSYEGRPIAQAVSRALYGNVLENSVTRLERFASCACAHFLNYGLQLNEREISQFAAMDMGNIYHLSLQLYAEKVAASDTTWFDIPEEMQKAFVEESLKEAVLQSGNQALAQMAKNQYFLYRMKKILYRTVLTLTNQVRQGKFTPSNFEVAFSFAEDLEAVNFALSEEEKMHLRGRIDRVDTYQEADKLYVKVIDYKSGNTSFELLSLYHGLQLQLVVYMNAAMEVLKKQHPDEKVVPAGIFYYHIDDPIIDGTGQETEVEIYDQILDKLKLNGLVNADANVYEAMDVNMAGASKVIPVALNKDGSLAKKSKTASEEEFTVIGEYVNQTIRQIGRQIMDGEVGARPYQMKDKDGCMYCPYGSVCGFDRKIPGFDYRKLETIDSEEEIIHKMEEKLSREDS